jgi:regulation of enolase protein 1 (concanavalin A-like superfamily)
MDEQAGLIWYLDDDNYIKLVKESLEGDEWIVLAREQGVQPELISKTRIAVKIAELQLKYLDSIFHGQFHTSPKDDWQVVSDCPLLEAAALKIGLFTHSGPQEIDRWIEMHAFA